MRPVTARTRLAAVVLGGFFWIGGAYLVVGDVPQIYVDAVSGPWAPAPDLGLDPVSHPPCALHKGLAQSCTFTFTDGEGRSHALRYSVLGRFLKDGADLTLVRSVGFPQIVTMQRGLETLPERILKTLVFVGFAWGIGGFAIWRGYRADRRP